MSEQPLFITALNDFIFCPASIYFHMLDENTDTLMYQDTCQLEGTSAHEKSDSGAYSSKKNMLQGVSVYSEQYGLIGKIDTFDTESGILTERKKRIKNIYDGYVFQLYGQYFALKELGYSVKKIRLYSMDDNKIYPVSIPEENTEMFLKFEKLIQSVHSFSFDNFRQDNPEKCRHCIYEPMCYFSVSEGDSYVHST